MGSKRQTVFKTVILKDFLKPLNSFENKFCWKSQEFMLLGTGKKSEHPFQWRGFNYIPDIQEIYSVDCIDTKKLIAVITLTSMEVWPNPDTVLFSWLVHGRR